MNAELLLTILDCFVWAMDKLTRPTLNNLLASYEAYERHSPTARLLERMQQEKFLQRHGRGQNAVFSITATGYERIREPSPKTSWDTPWDHSWRVVTFDLPMARQKDRYPLWRALRAHKLGLLQRSVWIWPHPLEPILREIIRAEGIPECFCGFESRRVFLCTDQEIVQSAWDWEEIHRRHRSYLQHPRLDAREARRARTLAELTRLARIEREAFSYAFSLDPLLPQVLWPKGYQGPQIAAAHREFRSALSHRFRELSFQ